MACPTFPAPADIRNDGHRRVRSWMAVFALLLATPAVAAPGWSAPVIITDKSFYYDISLNPAGDASLAWYYYGGPGNHSTPIFDRFKPAGGAFQAVQIVPPSSKQYVTGYDQPTPRTHVDPGGTSTVVYEADNVLWTADKPKNGAWQTAHRLTKLAANKSVFGSVTRFNTAADAVVAWTDTNTGELLASERRAGKDWSIPRRIVPRYAPGSNVELDVAVSEDGSAVLAWETFEYLDKRRHRGGFNYRLYTCALPSVGGGNWLRPNLLLGPDRNPHGAVVAVANHGRAGLIAQRADAKLVAFTEASAGGTWSGPVPIGAGERPIDVPSNDYELTFATDAGGHASYILADSANTLKIIDGDLATNRWLPPVAVSAPGKVGASQPFFRTYALGVAPDGFTVVGWWNDATQSVPGTAIAATRASPTAAFSPPTRFASASYQPFQIRVAAAAGQKAEVAWSYFDANITFQTIGASGFNN